MSARTPLPDSSGLVGRLRAAGCVFAEDEARLLRAAADTADGLTTLVDRRVAGEPLEHVLGWTEFCGRRIAVGPGVFVPRRRTELLAREAIALAGPTALVLDLCCGSGALGAAVAAAVPGARVHAADVDATALVWAQRNLPGGQVHLGDLFDALPASLGGTVDVLVANVPYVPTAAIGLLPPEAREHEPRYALDGGPDGLDVARALVDGAPGWLAPGGSVLFEVGEEQVASATRIVASAGLTPRVVTDEELGATVVIGTRG